VLFSLKVAKILAVDSPEGFEDEGVLVQGFFDDGSGE